MTLDDLELNTFEFSLNFAGFRRFRTQQQIGQYCQRQRCKHVETFGRLSRRAFVSNSWAFLFHKRLKIFTRFLPARRYASAGYSDRNVSVRPSVRPSVTRRYCVKTKKASGMISSPSGSPKTLVFLRQISSLNSKGFPPNGAANKGRS